MVNELIDIMQSLASIMTEETELVQARVRHRDLAAMADAKIRLVAALESGIARLAWARPDWADALDRETHTRLVAANNTLRDASESNALVLERQINLTQEMMSVVAAEDKRLTRGCSVTYGARGNLSVAEMQAPISVSTRL
jgi:flagellar biosynthesis/type III secretory pathway chaperone